MSIIIRIFAKEIDCDLYMKEIISILRPLQWTKNLFVFAPIFFSGNLFNKDVWPAGLLIFFSFCFISSSIYCLNDICDAELDQLHPQKCKRPIAAGIISKKIGYVMMFVCMCFSFTILVLLEREKLSDLLFVVFLYWFQNFFYCIKVLRTKRCTKFTESFPNTYYL